METTVMRLYTVWIKDQKDIRPHNHKLFDVKAADIELATAEVVRRLDWGKLSAGMDISIRDEVYHQESGTHGVVLSVHIGFDPMRDKL